ncbi:MAG: FAD-dependent oxidoreductase, partial [Acidobacteriaceae bacterium]|nr:FAD-dependent oxidoreductase [Acidobacteriaceae bacterium]
MSASDYDAVIIGAGAAGLTAFRELDRAGCKVICLEARDRVGGRILTLHDALSPVPIELGAEFIHGRSPEIWDIIHSARLAVYDCAESAVHIENGNVQGDGDAWELVHQVMQEMEARAAKGEDETFAAFLEQSKHPDNAKRLATSYV